MKAVNLLLLWLETEVFAVSLSELCSLGLCSAFIGTWHIH